MAAAPAPTSTRASSYSALVAGNTNITRRSAAASESRGTGSPPFLNTMLHIFHSPCARYPLAERDRDPSAAARAPQCTVSEPSP